MTEEQKELLKEKLKLFFEDKLNSLNKKIDSDINEIEKYKYDFYDNVIIPLREYSDNNSIKEKEFKKDNDKEKNKDKGIKTTEKKKDEKKKVEEKKEEKKKEEKKKDEKKGEEKKKEDKKTEVKSKEKNKKDDKVTEEHGETKNSLSISTKNENQSLSKTPRKTNQKRELDFKGKTEAIPKKTKVFSGKASHKPPALNTTIPKENFNKKNNISLTESNRKKSAEKVRTGKTPFNKKEKEKIDNKTNKNNDISKTAYKPSATKRFTDQKKTIGKKVNQDKKKIINKSVKKTEIKTDDKKEKIKKEKAEIKEEKKIILKDKSIYTIPDTFKNNNALFNIYLVIKRNYLDNRDKYKLIISNSQIYNDFGKDVKFLLNDKKNELKEKISELESFLKKYDDLPNIVSTVFQLSPLSLKSLMFANKEEMEKLINKGNLSGEFLNMFKIILYILDIEFDENLQNEDLLKFFMTELFVKSDKRNLMAFATDYFSKNKELNLSKEKIEKIENLIKGNEGIFAITEIAKKNRILSYFSIFIKEYHEFINKKTSDGIPYYELKNKNKLYNEYKYKLATIENNGIPPKKEEDKVELPKEEKKEIKEDKVEIKEDKKEIKEDKVEIKEDKKDIKEDKVEIKEEEKDIKEDKIEIKEEIKVDSKENNQKNEEITNENKEENIIKNKEENIIEAKKENENINKEEKNSEITIKEQENEKKEELNEENKNVNQSSSEVNTKVEEHNA